METNADIIIQRSYFDHNSRLDPSPKIRREAYGGKSTSFSYCKTVAIGCMVPECMHNLVYIRYGTASCCAWDSDYIKLSRGAVFAQAQVRNLVKRDLVKPASCAMIANGSRLTVENILVGHTVGL